MQPRKTLPEILFDERLITNEQLRECIELQRDTGRKLWELLIERGYFSEEDMVTTLSDALSIPRVPLDSAPIALKAVAEVPKSLARAHTVMPLAIHDDKLLLAMADPLDTMALDDVSIVAAHEPRPLIAPPSEILRAIERYYGELDIPDYIDAALNGPDYPWTWAN